MAAQLLEFALIALALTVNLAPCLLALGLAALIRTRAQAVLAIVNLCLLMEILATAADPTYGFGDLLSERLAASVLQVFLACGALALWRRRRFRRASIAAH